MTDVAYIRNNYLAGSISPNRRVGNREKGR